MANDKKAALWSFQEQQFLGVALAIQLKIDFVPRAISPTLNGGIAVVSNEDSTYGPVAAAKFHVFLCGQHRGGMRTKVKLVHPKAGRTSTERTYR